MAEIINLSTYNKQQDGECYGKRITLDYIRNMVNGLLQQNQKDIVIFTTGSSGRGEEYNEIDELEILFYHYGNIDLAKQVIETIKQYSGECEILTEFKDEKQPGYYEDNETRNKTFFPTRYIDRGIIYGDDEKLKFLYNVYLANILNATNSEIRDWKSRIDYHKKVSINGGGRWKGEKFEVFSQEERKIFYKKEGKTEISIKIGTLRYIQYTIMLIIMKLLRQRKINDLGDFIGTSIHNKLDLLCNFNLNLSYIHVQEIKVLYDFFLYIHSDIIKEIGKKGYGYMLLDSNELKLFMENLKDFNNLLENLKIK